MCLSDIGHDEFENYTRRLYREITVNIGKVIKFIDITFNFDLPEQVCMNMENCERSTLSECVM